MWEKKFEWNLGPYQCIVAAINQPKNCLPVYSPNSLEMGLWGPGQRAHGARVHSCTEGPLLVGRRGGRVHKERGGISMKAGSPPVVQPVSSLDCMQA